MKANKIINPLVGVAIMYIAMCVWMYFSAEVTLEGVALPQHDAGMIALAVWHAILLFAVAGAWLLDKVVRFVENFFDKTKKK